MIKKRLNIILIPVVTLLWVFIIYRIIAYIKPANSKDIPQLVWKDKYASIDNKDTIVLLANYRDPFKPTSYQQRRFNNVTSTDLTPIIKPVKIRPVWPTIEFGGIIKNAGNAISYAIVIINDKTELMASNDEIGGMKIKYMTPDSIQIILQDETKTYKKALK